MDEGVARRRILYFSHTRQVSGAERVLLSMLKVLDRSLYEPMMACPDEGAGNLDVLVRNAQVPVIAVPQLVARFTSNPLHLLGYVRSSVRAIFKARAVIREAAPDLIHANSVRAGLIVTLATAGARTPVLWHVQDDLPEHPISSAIRALARWSKRTQFVAVSRQTAQTFSGRRDIGERIRVLHNGIDLSRFPRKTSVDRESEFRRGLGIGPDEFVMISVGIIHPRKGLIELIEAFSLAKDRLPAGTRLLLVGAPLFHRDDLYLAKLNERVAELGLEDRICLSGASPDVPGVLRSADLLILNAYAEPFGLVLVEAASSGTAILATEVSGASEILAGSPPCGFLMPPPQRSSPHAVAEKMIAIAKDPEGRQAMADRAYESVRPRFSLDAFRVNLALLYDDLFEAQTRGADG